MFEQANFRPLNNFLKTMLKTDRIIPHNDGCSYKK